MSQEAQEPGEDKKPEPISEKHHALEQMITIATSSATTTSAKEQNMNSPSNTLAKKRMKDDIKTPSSKSPNSKRRKQLQAVLEITITVKPLQSK